MGHTITYAGARCRFIKFVEIQTSIKKLAVFLKKNSESYGSYAYINENGEYHFRNLEILTSYAPILEDKIIDKEEYDKLVNNWFSETLPSQETLTEADWAVVEVTAEEKARLEKEKGGAQALKLIEPRYARTPQDLFKYVYGGLIGLFTGFVSIINNKKRRIQMVSAKKIKATIVFIAILFMSLQIIASYFRFGSDIPLIDAVDTGEYDEVESLLKSGVDINEQDMNGNIALLQAISQYHFRAQQKSLQIIELLLQYKPDLSKNDWLGETAMALAIEYDESEIVDLLWAKLTISHKSSFLSFERNDWNGGVAKPLYECLFEKIICIVVPQLLQECFKRHKDIEQYCKAGKITLFSSRDTPQLIVIIPASLEELGIKIPESEKQKVTPQVDISSVENTDNLEYYGQASRFS